MAKTNGTTRSKLPSSMRSNAFDYIKAYTSKGGPDYQFNRQFDTEENRQAFLNYIEDAPKVDGDTLYRGSYMLAGDVVENLALGGWKDGDIISGSEMGQGVLSFSKDSERVFGYSGYKPKAKPSYSRQDNELQRVKWEVKTSGKGFVDISKQSIYDIEKESVTKASRKFRFRGAEYRKSGSYWLIKVEEV